MNFSEMVLPRVARSRRARQGNHSQRGRCAIFCIIFFEYFIVINQVRVKLDCNDEVIEVDEDDVEKANPPSFDRVEDLAQLRYLNESSVLHTLRQR